MSSRNILDPGDSTSQSFVIKIWLEETVEQTGEAVWRGRITHVPSGEEGALNDLNEVTAFISPYLESIGVKPTIRARMTRWAQNLRGQSLEEGSS